MKQLDLFASTPILSAVPTTPETPAVPADRIRAGHWYYIMLGFGGCDSRHIAAVEPDGRTDGGAGMFRGFGRNGAIMEPLPATPSWLAIDEDGREFHISANDLDGIGIGHIEEAFDYAPLLTPERLAELRERRRVLDAQEETARAKADAEFAAEVARIAAAPEYAHIPNRAPESRLWTKEITANVRADLAHNFPGQKFGVRKSEFSGGWEISVSWEDGPSIPEVDAIVRKFQPDCDIRPDDYIECTDTPFNRVFGSVRFLHTSRSASAATEALRDSNFTEWRETSYYTPPAPKPEREAPTGSAAPAPVSGVVVSENTARGGLEIKFPCRPNAAVLVSLKANGWRWSKFGGCWYHKADAAARSYAADLVSCETEKREEPVFDLDLALGY